MTAGEPAGTGLADREWLVGGQGVWMGGPAVGWRRLGPYPYSVEAVVRTPDGVLVGTDHGLWSAPRDPARRWMQLHDETLTSVLDVARTPAGITVAAGAYGVQVSEADDIGQPRWRSLTETRSPDERFTNRLGIESEQVWLAATEAGLLRTEDAGRRWELTGLAGMAARGLVRAQGVWWAGTDSHGLWRSRDGKDWTRVDTPARSVYSLAADGERLLLGAYDGIWCGRPGADAAAWNRSGPRALIRALAIADDLWLAGADPGGLWVSADGGGAWRRSGTLLRVTTIDAPQGGGEGRQP